MAELTDFKIGDEFTLQQGDRHNWRVTDIGTRTLIGIKLDQTDQRNYNGPPYSVAEHTFDEYDVGSIYAINGIICPGNDHNVKDSVWVQMSPASEDQ